MRLVESENIYIPNVFSPNNTDGLNDVFTIFANLDNIAQVNVLRIYNRWGERMFENANFQPNDLSAGWDGTFKEQALNPGVYVYMTEIEFKDGTRKIYSGDVTLVN